MNNLNLRVSASCQIPVLTHFYERYLANSGMFVEIGAYDGESWSNTSCLADIGYSGIYVEPVPAFAAACLKRHQHNNVQVFNLAIGDSESILELRLQHSITSADIKTQQLYDSLDWTSSVPVDGILKVRSITLDQLLAATGVSEQFALLVVDVEGYEDRVFAGFSIEKWRPTMIICELCDYAPQFRSNADLSGRASSVRKKISDSGYMQVYGDQINSIFVRIPDVTL